ncbi:hypothetical protein [Miniphocaeibacter halophilus]|uniref:Uncharacterized protein n=1 Tax=Miniphocaeibacter halophilus TaxID=2931922 RepID=A0AC61MUC5_9FIRM|nr:hypothetical protein [Miniphocaeibacter halophilus]QQK08220.1 hypothetical protein JFY71_01395 [Miniphocaeibacter halophilus]
MKTVEKVKLKVSFTINDGEKNVNKSKTYSSINSSASDENLKKAGDAVLTLIEGNNKNVYRIEEAILD